MFKNIFNNVLVLILVFNLSGSSVLSSKWLLLGISIVFIINTDNKSPKSDWKINFVHTFSMGDY